MESDASLGVKSLLAQFVFWELEQVHKNNIEGN